ncbi:MAG: hypothetical protein SNJ69_15500 [Chloroflexaceae bacterium]
MRRQVVSVTLMLCGAIMLVLGMVVVPAPVPVVAGPALQPSPRPPLEPTAPADEGMPAPTPIPYGRVTGTIIDLRTGAPAPGKLVVIGDSTVISDANGNYDRWVVSGFYNLNLQLRDGEGRVAQPPQQIAVGNGDTVVVHLFFTSAEPAAPAAPEPVATVTPTALPAPTPSDVTAVAPVSLPVTAATGARVPGSLLLAGAVLLGLGALLQVRPRRRAARRQEADQRLLRRMLATPPRDTSEE